MKCYGLLIVIVTLAFVPLAAGLDEGRWIVPEKTGENYGRISDLEITGDFLWVCTTRGIARVSLPTKTLQFYHYELLGMRVDSLFVGDTPGERVDTIFVLLYITAGDDEHLVFHGGSYPFFLLYEKGNWTYFNERTRRSPFGWDAFSEAGYCFDNSRRLVAGWRNGAARWNGSGWDTLFRFNDASEGLMVKLQYDGFDTLWAVSAAGKLYKYDGSQLQAISSNASVFGSIIRLLKDNQGRIRVVTNSALCSVNNNRLVADAMIDSATLDEMSYAFDSVGNFCYLRTAANGRSVLTKVFAPDYDSVWREDSSRVMQSSNMFGYLMANPQGLYALQRNKQDAGFTSWIKYYADNGEQAQSFSLRSLFGDYCRDFAANTNCLFFDKTDNSVIFGNIRHRDDGCFTMPPIGMNVNCYFRHSDGRFFAGTNTGLFLVNESESGWTAIPDLTNLSVTMMVQDKKGDLWGIARNFVFHETNGHWELTDTRNFNLPSYGGRFIAVDADGSIWVEKGGTIAKTVDGYKWTVFNDSNSILPNKGVRYSWVDRDGRFSVMYGRDSSAVKNLQDDKLTVATYDGSQWRAVDTIYFSPDFQASFFPVDLPYTIFYMDSWGDFWATFYNPSSTSGSTLHLYRYTDTTWIEEKEGIVALGEDNQRRVWVLAMNTGFPGYIIFEHTRAGIGAEILTDRNANRQPLRVGTVSGKRVTVDYSLNKPGSVSLAVFTPQGRLVATRRKGYCQSGIHREAFTAACSPGIYLVRLSTPEGSQVSRLVLR